MRSVVSLKGKALPRKGNARKRGKKKTSPAVERRKRPRVEVERRHGARQMHFINERSSPRDIALARSDLNNFFLDVLDKHHGGRFPDDEF